MSVAMHWWQCAYPDSPSSDDSFIKYNNDTRASRLQSLFCDSDGKSYGYVQRRRLTSARKLRHLTDNDIGNAPARLMVKPVPLPLPELEIVFKHDGPREAAGDQTFILPTQRGPRKNPGEKRATPNVYPGDLQGFQRMTIPNRPRVDTESQNLGTLLKDRPWRTGSFSAPTSPISTSPLTINDIFTPHHMPPPTLHIWSAPESPTYRMIPDAYNSPTYTPTQRTGVQTSIIPKSKSPLHKNMRIESPMARNDGNAHATLATGHPLPLPPGAITTTTPPPSSPHQINSRHDSMPRLRSPWQKGKLIGRGTFGRVYVGSNRETGALCAMKEVELLPDDPKSVECIKQLEQEIDVLSELKHPNIVQYYGCEIVDDKFYIYLEYIHPGPINKYVRDHCGGMTESIVRNFTRHIVSGLAYLHSTRTMHRDIKGANLLVDINGVVKLADFGMAKHLNEQAGYLSLKGSPYWMAPELLQLQKEKDGNPDLGLAVDIWSLGCTIIEMIDGRPPWSEYEGPAAMFKVMKENPQIPENLSVEGKDFLNGCFTRNPAERPSASMLLEHEFLNTSHTSHVPYILMGQPHGLTVDIGGF